MDLSQQGRNATLEKWVSNPPGEWFMPNQLYITGVVVDHCRARATYRAAAAAGQGELL